MWVVYTSTATDIKVTITCSNVKRFRGGLVFKAHRLLNSRLESNKEEEWCEEDVRGVHQDRHRHQRHDHLCSGSEAGSYLRLIDLCVTQL